MEFRSARRSERDEVLDLLALWYGDREFFARYNQKDPTFRDELSLVAIDQGRIVSTAQIFDRKINLEGKTVPIGGIGSVFTREDYRHKRVASGLMNLAIDVMERNGFEVSLLFAERLTFYNQFGWKEVKRNFTLLGNAAELRTPQFENLEIDVFDRDRDLREVIAIHRGYSGRFNITAIRDDADWRANLEYAGNMPADPVGGCEEYFIIARLAHEIAAYARATRFHGIVMVMEFGYKASNQSAMLALIRHLGEMLSSGRSSFHVTADHGSARALLGDKKSPDAAMIVTHTSHDAELEKAISAAGCPVRHHADNLYMWRINLPDKLAHRFEMTPQAASDYFFAKVADPRSLFWTADRF
jgi:predicted N-acetyltransferase YhbS